jgi:predicted phage terminase large subunit-like protein
MENFEGSDLERILSACYKSTRIVARTLFPDRFYLPFYKIHDPLFAVLDDPTINKAVVTAPRGFGKTSIMNLAYPAKKILFHEKKFIVPISNSATQAVMQSENLKRELMSNSIVRRIFGPIKANKADSDGIDDTFTKDMWVTSGGTLVFPRGSGQQVRGILHGDYRPDLILGDDLESTEGVKSEDQRKKMKEWLFADVIGSVSRHLKNWKIVIMGTLLHEDSLLANLMSDPNWIHLNIELCDDNYNSLWPEFISSEELHKLADSYRSQGLLDVFFREYRNLPISTEDATFKIDYFKYYEESPEMNNSEVIETIIIVDPAKTVKKHSDFSAIVGVGFNLDAGRVYFRDCVAERMHPDRIYDEAFDMAKRLNASVIAIKTNSLNEFITYPIRNEMFRRGLNYEIVEVPERQHKEDRIAMMVPFYRRGLVFHNKAASGGLEAQLLSFPRSKRDDIMDAFADFIYMLDSGERYFTYNKPDKASRRENEELDRMEKEDEDDVDEDYGDDAVANWNNYI